MDNTSLFYFLWDNAINITIWQIFNKCMMRTAFVTTFGHEHLVFITSESDSSITVQRFSFLPPDDIKANCFGLQVLSFSLVDSDEILLKDIRSIRNVLMVKKSYIENNFVKCHDELELYAVVDKSIPSEYIKYFIHSIFELSRTAINICDLSPICQTEWHNTIQNRWWGLLMIKIQEVITRGAKWFWVWIGDTI
jgi:hypothetical protein